MTEGLSFLVDGVWAAQVTAYSVTVRAKSGGGWLALAKGHNAAGQAVVCFALATTPDDALNVLARSVHKPERWQPDRLAAAQAEGPY